MSHPVRSAPARLIALIGVPVLFFVALIAWAIASPVGSSPDDNFHLASIWCGSGEREGICEPSGNPDTRMVPAALTDAACYAFRPNDSAACWVPDRPGMKEATWMNAVGLYPPLFYATMSVFVGPDIQTSVVTMRIVNSFISVGLLTAVFFALPLRLRPALVLSSIVSAVPLGIFVLASTNPSSWAYLAACVIWVCIYGTTMTSGKRQIVLAGLAVVATALGAGARADAAIFAIFGTGIALLIALGRGAFRPVPLLASAAVAAVAVALYFSAGQSGTLASGLPTDTPPLTRTEQLDNLGAVPLLWLGAFGSSGLGWLDTVVPPAVSLLGLACAAAVVFVGIHRPAWQRGTAVFLAFAALWLVPFVMLSQSNAVVGEIVQSRYLLPLIVILLGAAAAGTRALSDWAGARSATVALVLIMGNSLSLHDHIRRYTFGLDGNAIDPGVYAEWWWAAAPSPLVVWGVGSAAFAAALALLWFVLGRSTRATALVAAQPVERTSAR